MPNIVLFGPPGSGKGTQSQKLIDEYGLFHISTGDVLRQQIAEGTELGKIADSYISQGALIPDELMLEILNDYMNSHKEAENGVIFDGFPRTVAQAEALDKLLKKRGSELHLVLGLEVEDEELTNRLINRGKDSGRSDDNPETIKKRIEVYHSSTMPLKDFYKKSGHYRGIKGVGHVDEIFGDLKKHVDSVIKK